MNRKKIAALLTALYMLVILAIQPLCTSAFGTEDMDALISSYPRDCAILICTGEGETLYSYQPDKMILGASLIKLPYAVFVCQQLTAGVRSLDDTMTYTSSWYHGGSGVIRHNGYGKSYTIRELLDYSLRYSDNVAYDMLVYLFGVEGFNSMVESWGYSVRIANPSPRFPAVSASFMKDAMLEMQVHVGEGDCWNTCWTALNESENVYTRAILGENGDVAVKYGLVQSVYHEVCYVDGDTPFVLVILSGAVNYTPDSAFVKNVATSALQIVAEYADYMDALILPGDVNGDGLVNASDAARILIAAALLGASETSGLTEAQEKAADVDGDGLVNSSDAALVLMYAAYVGAGGTGSLTEFLQTDS